MMAQKNSHEASFLENLLCSRWEIYTKLSLFSQVGQTGSIYNLQFTFLFTKRKASLTIYNESMTVYLASDHAGLKLKEKIKKFLRKEGYKSQDFGAYSFDKDDDYPDFISKVAGAVSKDPQSRGIILGGSGEGEAIVANKFTNVRAAVFYGGNLEIVRLSREHNDANILSLGARFVQNEEALKVVKLWLETSFSKQERHTRRIEKIKRIEENR